jgi:hypothetical protein
MILTPSTLNRYHVFLASPADVNEKRQAVRQFFDRYNQSTAHLWGVRFEVVDWENYASIGVGRPQELITQQTLDRFARFGDWLNGATVRFPDRDSTIGNGRRVSLVVSPSPTARFPRNQMVLQTD